MKKFFFIFLFIALLTFSGCSLFGGEKTFSENGVSVVLDNTYQSKTKDFTGLNLVLEGINSGFMANIESKQDFSNYYSLREYTELVLTGRDYENLTLFSEDDVEFYYTIYEAEAEGINYKYMLVTLMNDENFMTCNFFSAKSKFEDFREKFLDAAKTIKFTD